MQLSTEARAEIAKINKESDRWLKQNSADLQHQPSEIRIKKINPDNDIRYIIVLIAAILGLIAIVTSA